MIYIRYWKHTPLFNRDMEIQKRLQKNSWTFQCIITCIAYIPCLIVVAILINFVPSWNYDPGIIFDNREINTKICCVTIMGLFSLLLSFKPDVITALRKMWVSDFYNSKNQYEVLIFFKEDIQNKQTYLKIWHHMTKAIYIQLRRYPIFMKI